MLRNAVVPMRAISSDSLRRGERGVIERIYREHRGDVERAVRNRLRRARKLTTANVSDVVQEVFAKAFSDRARARYDATREFAPFLQRIARNVLVDWLRRCNRQVTSDTDIDDLECDDRAAGSYSLFPQDLIDTTRWYVSSLDVELRRVYELRLVAGAAQLDAARSLGISRQELRTLERKLVDGLRRKLAV